MKPKVDELDYNILSQFFEKIKGMDIIQNAMFSKLNELVEGKKKTETEEDASLEARDAREKGSTQRKTE